MKYFVIMLRDSNQVQFATLNVGISMLSTLYMNDKGLLCTELFVAYSSDRQNNRTEISPLTRFLF